MKMWKIKNNRNRIYLEKFESKIILPVFEMIVEVSQEIKQGAIILPILKKDVWRTTKVFSNFTRDQKELYNHFMQKTVKGNRLEDLLFKIIVSYDYYYLISIYDLYKIQRNEVYAGNYAIDQSTISKDFKDIFIDFYYENFFVDQLLWRVIVGESYDRSIFHEYFRTENELSVCPYCDIDSIVSVSNINIEHFLPKSKFPLLSMNPLNLISSCIAYNKAHEGKGDRVSPPPIVTPYNEMIGDSIEFKIDFNRRILTLHNTGGEAQENYLQLLKLYSRYADSYIYFRIDKRAKSLFETLSNYASPSKRKVYEYISRKEKEDNLSLALMSAISTYSQYRRYK